MVNSSGSMMRLRALANRFASRERVPITRPQSAMTCFFSVAATTWAQILESRPPPLVPALIDRAVRPGSSSALDCQIML